VTAGYAVLALFVVLLVVIPAAVLAIRAAGDRLVGDRLTDEALSEDDLASLADLHVAGFASNAEIAALSLRERRFLARTAGARLAGSSVAGTNRDLAAPQKQAADREVPLRAFFLVCPACGASLGTAADVAHYVGSCPSCSRRVATRRRGSRVSLGAVDSVRPDRPPTRRG
jgi:hypothetical protein